NAGNRAVIRSLPPGAALAAFVETFSGRQVAALALRAGSTREWERRTDMAHAGFHPGEAGLWRRGAVRLVEEMLMIDAARPSFIPPDFRANLSARGDV